MTPGAHLPASSPEDAVLVARLKAGDEDAYEQLVRANGSRLLAVARRILRDEDAAADAVQEAFVNAFRAMPRFGGDAQLSTWLHRIVVNTCLMRVRRRMRKPEQSLDTLLPAFADDGHHAERVASWAEAADRRLEREDVKRLVWEGLAQLPEPYRALIVMRDIEGLSTREAADSLGVNDNALKLRLHRARQALAVIIRRRLTTTPADSSGARRALVGEPGAQVAAAARRTVTAPQVASAPGRSAASAIRHAAL